MAKTSVDDLLEALNVIRVLQQIIGKQGQEIVALGESLSRMEKRLDLLEQRPAT